MKLIIATIAICMLMHYSLQTTNCPATSYCKGCDTTTGHCNACHSHTSFFKGAMKLSNNVCVAWTTAEKNTACPTGQSHAIGYISSAVNGGNSTTCYCKSGYYFYAEGTAASAANISDSGVTYAYKGCYASSGASSSPMNNVTWPSPTTNCGNVTGYKYTITNLSTVTAGNCYLCQNGSAPNSSGNNDLNCSGTSSISNCAMGKYESTDSNAVQNCEYCNSGYTVAENGLSCLSQTNVPGLANCAKANTDGTTCKYCDNSSYFGGLGVCVKAASLNGIAVLLVAFMALLQI